MEILSPPPAMCTEVWTVKTTPALPKPVHSPHTMPRITCIGDCIALLAEAAGLAVLCRDLRQNSLSMVSTDAVFLQIFMFPSRSNPKISKGERLGKGSSRQT